MQQWPAVRLHRALEAGSCGAWSLHAIPERLRTRKVKIFEQRRIFDDFFKIDEARLAFETFGGRMSQPVRRLVFERGDSVAAVVFVRDTRRIVMVEQFRFPAFEKGPGWITELAAGMIDKGEKPEAAMCRELEEEMGYRVSRLRHIATFYLSPGGSSERIWLYGADVTEAARVAHGGGLAAEHEDIRVVTWSLAQARAAVAGGKIVDAKTLIGLQWLLAREDARTRRASARGRRH